MSKAELNHLLEIKEMSGIPIIILSNKIDVQPHLTENEIVKGLNLDYISENHWVLISISALYGTNLERVLEWLLTKSREYIKK